MLKYTSLIFLILFHTFYSPCQTFQALDRPLNTPLTSEFNPSLSANGRIILFSSGPPEVKAAEILISYQHAGIWSRPEPIPALNNPSAPVNSYSLSHDGNSIFFSMSKYGGIGGYDIWYIEKANKVWTEPKNLGKPVNTSTSETDPSLSPDGKILYFTRAVDKKTALTPSCGKIFSVERKGKDAWAEPKELPASINMGCEANPSILSDNCTLLFSSIRQGGKGDFDQYKSELSNNGTWSNPVPLVYLNSTGDDRYISIQGPGDYVYLRGIAKIGTDIVRAKIPEQLRPKKILLLQGQLLDSINGKSIAGKMIVKNLTNNKIKILNTKAGEEYFLTLPEKENVYISWFSENPGYSFFSERLNLDTLGKYREQRMNIKLLPLKAGVSIPLNYISFSALEMLGDSYLQLENILRMLRENTTLVAEIALYDDFGAVHAEASDTNSSAIPQQDSLNKTTTFKLDRTKKKVRILEEYFLNKGIKSERLKVVAYALEHSKAEYIELKILK